MLLVFTLPINPVSGMVAESNLWPLFVGEREAPGEAYDKWQAAGPLVFARDWKERRAYGVRPFYTAFQHHEEEALRDFHILYPLFNHRRRYHGHSWNVLTLLRFQKMESRDEEHRSELRLSPLFFSGRGPEPEDNYFGLMPFFGDVPVVFGQDRFFWVLFPLYARAETEGRVLTMTPWPFIRVFRGEDASGFDLWPFYGHRQVDGRYERRYYLWPFVYHVKRDLHKDVPFEAFGALPFYTSSRSETAESRTVIWPFFGYTHSTDPEYREIRYFWPLVVQRRGEIQYTNRIAPFYTRSIRQYRDKQWIMWPFYRHEKTVNRNMLEEKTQFLYFFYWSLKQSDPSRPEAEPARKRHVWPLFSHWDDGAGRRQTQWISPLEVFFQHNEVVRNTYTPLFALYQRDIDKREARSRHHFLFNLVTWQRAADDYRLNVGPLLTVERETGARGFEILKGLVGYDREDGLSLFWLDFSRNDDEKDEGREEE